MRKPQLKLFGPDATSSYVEHVLSLQCSPELQTRLHEADAVIALRLDGSRTVIWGEGALKTANANRQVLHLRISDDDDCWFLIDAVLRAKGVTSLDSTAGSDHRNTLPGRRPAPASDTHHGAEVSSLS
jgi:hypothetical protein